MHSTFPAASFPCTVIDWRARLEAERRLVAARADILDAMRRFSLKLVLVLVSLLAGVAIAWHLSGRNRWPLVNAPVTAVGPIVCFGDSLVAGVGAESATDSYPAQLQKLTGHNVFASGVPGECAADGWRRLQGTPELHGAVVIVTLGGNDILQRRPWAETAEALGNIFRDLQRRGALVVYTGVDHPLAPRLRARQRALCRQCGVLFVPSVLNGIVDDPKLKADQVHPNAEGYRRMAERVAAALTPIWR